jgi:hypothetical protein
MNEIINSQQEEPYDYAKGEIALWRAVISQSLSDSTIKSYAKPEYSKYRSQAQEWLSKPNIDFKTVCDYAGLDPITVRKKSIAYMLKNKKVVIS